MNFLTLRVSLLRNAEQTLIFCARHLLNVHDSACALRHVEREAAVVLVSNDPRMSYIGRLTILLARGKFHEKFPPPLVVEPVNAHCRAPIVLKKDGCWATARDRFGIALFGAT